MRGNLVRWAVVIGFALAAAACGDSVLDPASSTAGPETTVTTQADGTSTIPPVATTTTVPAETTTTIDPAESQCLAAGGVFVAAEGPAGICFPADAIAAGEYVIRRVDFDDPDGGLLVWTGPGAPGSKVPQPDKYARVGVIPPYAEGVEATGHATPDDFWYYVRYEGFEGWARSAFLAEAGSAPALPPCWGPGVGRITGTATGLTSIEGDFDDKAGVDTLSVYWDGADWIVHLRTAYGHHAEMPSGHTGMEPGTGPGVFAGLAYDFLADGQDEAWVYDDSPASGEVWSLFTWFNDGCELVHVSHHSTGLVHYWEVGTTPTHIDSMSCWEMGIVLYHGSATGLNDYIGEGGDHWYEYEDGVAAEWWAIGGGTFDTSMGDQIPHGFECPWP
jgi:hypothetical protein